MGEKVSMTRRRQLHIDPESLIVHYNTSMQLWSMNAAKEHRMHLGTQTG